MAVFILYPITPDIPKLNPNSICYRAVISSFSAISIIAFDCLAGYIFFSFLANGSESSLPLHVAIVPSRQKIRHFSPFFCFHLICSRARVSIDRHWSADGSESGSKSEFDGAGQSKSLTRAASQGTSRQSSIGSEGDGASMPLARWSIAVGWEWVLTGASSVGWS
jgi:hypothetical protein